MEQCRHVAGQVDLRDDLDAAGLRESHDVFDVVSRVELPAGGQLLQLRRAEHFETPGLVVGQLPLEHVEFAERHLFEDLFQLLDRHKVPGAVELEAADIPAGFIRHRAEVGIVEIGQLVEGRQRADDAFLRSRLYRDALFPDGQMILFRLFRFNLVQEQPGALFGPVCRLLYRDAGAV